MSNGKTNKTKGSNAERYYAEEFRKLGFKHCVTSRFGSRISDNAKIDLINIPFNVQIKAGHQRGMKPSKVLKDMEEEIEKYFPKGSDVYDKLSLVIHKQAVGKGKKRTEHDEIVHMSFETFKNLIKKIKWE